MTVTRTVVPGDWYGVLGASVIVLLPPAAKSRVAGLWETVDDGAGFDEVLDALISGGLRELPAFVLVSGDGRDVMVVIRGAGLAELTTPDGPVTVSGAEDTTWVEKNVHDVSGIRVQVAEGAGAAYTIDTGLIRVASVEHPAAAGHAGVPDAEAVAVPVAPPLTPPAEPEPPKRILPPDPQLEQHEPPAPEPTAAPTVVTSPVAPIPDAPVPVSTSLGDPSFDPLTSPELAVSPEHAGDTRASSAVARLIVSSGEDEIGLVTVPSPHQEISSTHLEIRPGEGADQGAAVVTDLGSTNGTVVVQPGLPAEDLRPGIGVQLIPGATIDLGEGVTIQVTRV